MNSALRRRARRRLAGVVALFTLGLGLFWSFSPHPVTPARQSPSTASLSLPEHRTLHDGSVVELAPDARIIVDFSPAARRVLLESGEAHFQVAKESARPFIVAASGIDIRAVGTAFSVRTSTHNTEVVVVEGRVVVQAAQSPSARTAPSPLPSAVLDAGQRIEVAADDASDFSRAAPTPVSVSKMEINQRLAWRVPRLEFNATPLAQAIPLFNERSPIKLHLDPSLGALEMSGSLRVDGVDGLLALLKNDFGITISRRTETDIWLAPR